MFHPLPHWAALLISPKNCFLHGLVVDDTYVVPRPNEVVVVKDNTYPYHLIRLPIFIILSLKTQHPHPRREKLQIIIPMMMPPPCKLMWDTVEVINAKTMNITLHRRKQQGTPISSHLAWHHKLSRPNWVCRDILQVTRNLGSQLRQE